LIRLFLVALVANSKNLLLFLTIDNLADIWYWGRVYVIEVIVMKYLSGVKSWQRLDGVMVLYCFSRVIRFQCVGAVMRRHVFVFSESNILYFPH
jgi:hypothetical protein